MPLSSTRSNLSDDIRLGGREPAGTKGVPTLMAPVQENALYYGDNLPILRTFPDGCVDLIYLDPPFNSNADYNAIFKDESGRRSDAQIKAFEDTWHWGPRSVENLRYLTNTQLHGGRVPEQVSKVISAFVEALGTNQMTAYLVEMTVRLVELRRILKDSGSLYLHCNEVANSYLRVLLDALFGATQFQNEIIWHYSGWNKKLSSSFESRADTILFYTRDARHSTFNSYARRWKSKEE